MDRHAATRRLRQLAQTAEVRIARPGLHHAIATGIAPRRDHRRLVDQPVANPAARGTGPGVMHAHSLWVTIALMALLVVVTGPPGAGKSTVAGLLADRFGQSVLVPGDAFFAFVARGAVEPWLPAAHGQIEVVTRAAAAAAGRYAAGG